MKMTLTAVCDFQGGTQPPKNEWIDHEANGYVRMLQIRDFTQSEKDNIEYVKDTKNLKKCNENDILIGRYGASVGKILTGLSGAYNVAIVKAIPDTEKIFARYLYYFFTSPYFQNFIKSVGSRAAQAGFNKDDLKNAVIPLISTDEQRKIAAVLDKVSDLIAKRRQQLDKLDELIKARFVEMFGDPVENPMSWDKIALGKRCDIVTGNTPSRAEPENYGNFIEWIKSDNINTPAVLLTEAHEYLSETGFHKCRFVEAGSLLMTCIAGSINCIGNVAVTDRRVAFNQQINAIVPKQDDVLYLYWLMLLSKPAIHSTINMALKGILSKGQLSEMVFPFPPIELQNQFAAFVEQTEKTKTTISESLEKLETLKKALMQEYFG